MNRCGDLFILHFLQLFEYYYFEYSLDLINFAPSFVIQYMSKG